MRHGNVRLLNEVSTVSFSSTDARKILQPKERCHIARNQALDRGFENTAREYASVLKERNVESVWKM